MSNGTGSSTALLLMAILLFGVASFAGASMLGFSIISADNVNWGEDGLPVWVFSIAPSGDGEQIVFIDGNDLNN